MSLTAAQLVAKARLQINEITPQEFSAITQNAAIIDVREPAEFQTGHLPGAVNIPRGVLEFEVLAHPAVCNVTDPALADRSRHVVIYCRSGGRAALAAAALQQLGFTQVRSITGGLNACVDAGLPLTMH